MASRQHGNWYTTRKLFVCIFITMTWHEKPFNKAILYNRSKQRLPWTIFSCNVYIYHVIDLSSSIRKICASVCILRHFSCLQCPCSFSVEFYNFLFSLVWDCFVFHFDGFFFFEKLFISWLFNLSSRCWCVRIFHVSSFLWIIAFQNWPTNSSESTIRQVVWDIEWSTSDKLVKKTQYINLNPN